ncbi:MAG: type II secretion system F family protein [Bacillota bacterium]|nr:type II secretion system F family protein [Bacillota bacterium]
MVPTALKWLAALAWAATCLVIVDLFRPLRRDEAVWRVIEPGGSVDAHAVLSLWLRRWGGRVRRVTPQPLLRWMERTSAHLPDSLGCDGWFGLTVAFGLAGAVWLLPSGETWRLTADGLCRVVGRMLTGFALGSSGALAWMHLRATERRSRVERDLPGMVDLLLLGLEGGLSLSNALGEAARRLEGPLGEELAEVDRQVALGLPRAEALRAMAARLGIRELETVVALINQAESLGSGVTKAVGAIAKRLRTSRVLTAERRAGEAPVKMLFPLVFCLFPSVLVLLVGPLLISRGRALSW